MEESLEEGEIREESLESGEIREEPGQASSVRSLSTDYMEWWRTRRHLRARVSSVTFDSSGLPIFREEE
jgi:hypothetical protein